MSAIVNAMSVDVEDYFHASAFDRVVPRPSWPDRESRVVANTERLLQFFHEHQVRSTFFVLGWVAHRFPSLVRQIAGLGHEVASHGFDHQLVYSLTRDQFRADVRRSKRTIEDAGGVEVRGYRAPSFSMVRESLWALDVLIDEGFDYDASVFPIHHDRYGIPGSERRAHVIERPAGSLVEVPAPTVRLGPIVLPLSGGGYFRLLPYAWTKWGIGRVNDVEREPVVFYLHPWEIDPHQPRLAVSRVTARRHYHGLSATLPRLAQLVRDFSFDTVAAALALRGLARPAATTRLSYAH